MSYVRFLWIGLRLQADSNSPEPLTSREVGSIPHPHPQSSGGRENSCPPEAGGGRGDALVAQCSPLSQHIFLECSAARHRSTSSSRLLPALLPVALSLIRLRNALVPVVSTFFSLRIKGSHPLSPLTCLPPPVFFASSCCCDCLEF